MIDQRAIGELYRAVAGELNELAAFRLSDGGGRNPIRFRAADVERFLAERRLEPSVKARRRGWRGTQIGPLDEPHALPFRSCRG